ncbi:MAG: PEP/pyruvate-binding domain-containing protein [Caldisericia bacterium]
MLENIRVPNTWYLLSDVITDFIHYNSLEEVMNFKYKEISEIRQEFHYFEQLFKNSQFNRSIVKGLSFALKDIGNRPIIIRSSSLLEDSFEGVLCWKIQKSFPANTGTVKDRSG